MGVKEDYLNLKNAVRCVVESYDYMYITEENEVNPKRSTCEHGCYQYEGCEACICKFLGGFV